MRITALTSLLILAGCGGGDAEVESAEPDVADGTVPDVDADAPDEPDGDATGPAADAQPDAVPDAVSDADDDLDADAEVDLGDDAEQDPDAGPVYEPLVISRALLPTVAIGGEVSFTFEVESGTPPITDWRIANGDEAHGAWHGVPLGQNIRGLTIDDSGTLFGNASEAGLYTLVVTATDANGQEGRALVGLRVTDSEEPGELAQRAAAYQENYEARHFRNGFSYDLQLENLRPGCETTECLTTLGDETFVSGQCTMAMAFRAGTIPNEDTIGLARAQIDGWRFFESLVGVPGVVGRSYVHIDDDVDTSDISMERFWPETEYHRGEGELSDWFWRGDASRDQMTGAVLGIAALNAFVDDDHVRTESAAFLNSLAHHLLDHDMQIFDSDGERTTYGDINGWSLEGFPIANGLNAVCALAWIKAAAVANDDAELEAEYRRLAFDEEYIRAMRQNMWVYMGYATVHFNTYMAFENFFHLMRLEEDPEIREQLRDIFRDTLWLNTDDNTPNRRAVIEHNPVKTAWYLFSTGERDAEALWHAVRQMRNFPDSPLLDHVIMNSEDPSVVINPSSETESLYALRSDQLLGDMVMWHRSTFRLDGAGTPGNERTGCDYLLPYWMGRYYGFIGEDW